MFRFTLFTLALPKIKIGPWFLKKWTKNMNFDSEELDPPPFSQNASFPTYQTLKLYSPMIFDFSHSIGFIWLQVMDTNKTLPGATVQQETVFTIKCLITKLCLSYHHQLIIYWCFSIFIFILIFKSCIVEMVMKNWRLKCFKETKNNSKKVLPFAKLDNPLGSYQLWIWITRWKWLSWKICRQN